MIILYMILLFPGLRKSQYFPFTAAIDGLLGSSIVWSPFIAILHTDLGSVYLHGYLKQNFIKPFT